MCGAVVAIALVGACSSGPSDRSDAAPSTTRADAPTTTVPRPTPVEFAPDDETFSAVPDPIPAGTHGDLLRYQVVAHAPDGGRWFRIMYLSTTVPGEPTVVTGTLVVPDGDPPAGGWRLATHAHGSTGLADDCAPSYNIASGSVSTAELQVVATNAIERGFVLVSTDYEGQGGPGRHPFLVGQSEGRSVLDAARAARGFPGVEVTDVLAVIGYSQGGHGALWANQIAAEWTPEFEVVGTVAGSPASEVADLFAHRSPPPEQNAQVVGIVAGLEAADPDLAGALDDILTADGRALLDAMDTSCLSAGQLDLEGPLLTSDPSTVEPWNDLMAANTPGSVATNVPILVIHSIGDETIPVDHARQLTKRLCTVGQVVELRTPEAGGHVAAAVPAYADGFTWIESLLAGTAPVDSCGEVAPSPPG